MVSIFINLKKGGEELVYVSLANNLLCGLLHDSVTAAFKFGQQN